MIITSLEEIHRQDFQSLFCRYAHSIYENFPHISEKQPLLYEAKQLLTSKKNGDVEILVALDNNGVVGTVVYGKRDWDTKHFGFKIGSISNILTNKSELKGDPCLQEMLLTSAVQDLNDQEIRCIICRINSNETSLIHTLERNCFMLMDILSTFFADTSKSKIREAYAQIKPHKKSDVKSLIEIATETFELGHFFANTHFPIKKCHQLYGKWIENACKGLTDEVLVAYVNKKPVGFITCRKDENASSFFETNIGIIDLVAVSKKYQGQGIGSDLMTSALNWFNNNQIRLVKIGTHLNNLTGIRLNLKTGFQCAFSETTFHKWI